LFTKLHASLRTVFTVQAKETHIQRGFVIPTGQTVLLGQSNVCDETQEIRTDL